jgi:DNA polymerase III epsilon subunit-like protein
MKQNFEHLMLDLETMGHNSNSCIVSIGAVEFNIETGDTGREFYINIDLQSCLDAGLHVTGSTVYWWLQQSNEARCKLLEDPIILADALYSFTRWLGTNQYYIWGNSARFDCGLLENAYDKLKIPAPWTHNLERDVRTLVSFAPDIKKETKFEGVKHDAIDDCKHQIKYCSKIWNKLNK